MATTDSKASAHRPMPAREASAPRPLDPWDALDMDRELRRLMASKDLPLKLVLDSGLVVFCDAARTVRARVPNDPHRIAWPLRAARVKSFIAMLYHRECGEFLAPALLTRTLAVLEGMAWGQEPERAHDLAVEALLDSEPVARALVERVNEGEFVGTMTELWQELAGTAIRNGWLRTRSRWPANARSLSELINRLRPFLENAGIAIEPLPRTARKKSVRIRRYGDRRHDAVDARFPLPATPRVAKPGTELPPPDAHGREKNFGSDTDQRDA